MQASANPHQHLHAEPDRLAHGRARWPHVQLGLTVAKYEEGTQTINVQSRMQGWVHGRREITAG